MATETFSLLLPQELLKVPQMQLPWAFLLTGCLRVSWRRYTYPEAVTSCRKNAFLFPIPWLWCWGGPDQRTASAPGLCTSSALCTCACFHHGHKNTTVLTWSGKAPRGYHPQSLSKIWGESTLEVLPHRHAQLSMVPEITGPVSKGSWGTGPRIWH